MAVSNIVVDIKIKKWCKPVIYTFVFFGMYPPKWCFSVSALYNVK